MPSPNPESDEDENKSAAKAKRSTEKPHRRARHTSGLSDDPRLIHYVETKAEQHRAKEESYWFGQVFWQRVTAFAAIAAFAAASYYACQAKQQVVEAVNANMLAHENAIEDLRAYVNTGGGPNHKLAEMIYDASGSRVINIAIYFFNGGKTPAHNFIASFATGGLSSSTGKFNSPEISRFVIIDGQFGGMYFGGGGVDIPSQSTYVEYISPKQLPTSQELSEIRKGKEFSIFGAYAYCDEFGEYRCRSMALNYDSRLSDFVPGPFMDMRCFDKPVCPPPEPAKMLALKRCEQPDEQKKADAIADANAGKVFPPYKPILTPNLPATHK